MTVLGYFMLLWQFNSDGFIIYLNKFKYQYSQNNSVSVDFSCFTYWDYF